MSVTERSSIEQGTTSFSEYLSATSDIYSEILAFLAALCLKIISLQTRSYFWCSFANHARSSLMSNVLSFFELVRHRPLRPICLFLNDDFFFYIIIDLFYALPTET